MSKREHAATLLGLDIVVTQEEGSDPVMNIYNRTDDGVKLEVNFHSGRKMTLSSGNTHILEPTPSGKKPYVGISDPNYTPPV